MVTATRTVVDALESFVIDTRAVVHEIAASTVEALADQLEAGRTPGRRHLAQLEGLVRRRLGNSPAMLHGAGFVAAPGLLDDAAWWLEWFAWTPSSTAAPRVERLVPQTDPAGPHFFDYTLMPWYAGPAGGSQRVITGPYVDYLCTDDYTLTFTEAVRVGGFEGVAGADVRVLAVEQEFLGRLRASDRVLAVVNELGRVVVSNSARLLSGNLVDEVDVPALFVEGSPDLCVVAGSELAVLDLGPR